MAGLYSRQKNWETGDILTEADLEAAFDHIYDNLVASTTSAVGLVQLEDSVTSTSVTKAATPKSVKEAYDHAGSTLPVVDTTGIAKGSVDATKIVRLEVDGLTTGSTRVLTVPDKDMTLADASVVATNTAKATNATHTGEVTGSGALTITDKAVTLTKMNDMATASLLGRNTAVTGVPEVLSKATSLSLLNVADGATKYPDTGEQAFLDADHTKLDGIEATADITDATNVASTTHGVTAKASMVDADELGLVDSAASWVLKKFTFTNLKAFLKTYFDNTYAVLGANSDITSLSGLTTDLSIAQGGTGQSTAQTAINALSTVSEATNEHVLTKDTSTGDAIFKVASGSTHVLVAKTANYNVLAADLTGLKTFTNNGAAAEITLSLPARAANYKVGFIVVDAQYLKILANGTDTFRYGATQGAAGGYVRCNMVGTAWVITDSGDDWLISPLSGIIKYDE